MEKPAKDIIVATLGTLHVANAELMAENQRLGQICQQQAAEIEKLKAESVRADSKEGLNGTVQPTLQ